MRIRSLLGALVIATMPLTSVWAENMTPEDIKKLVDEAVDKKLQEHERREGSTERKEGTAASTEEPGIGPLPDVAKDLRTEKQPALSFSSTGSGRLVYAKPFVSSPKAIVPWPTSSMAVRRMITFPRARLSRCSTRPGP